MVFGTSGGGMKTAFLMASPAAAGLIHRAAAQSGPGLRFMEPDRARGATARLFRALDLREGDVAALQNLPAERLLAGYHAVAAQMPASQFIELPCFAPVLDTDLLPHHPFSPEAAPLASRIPLLLGWNAQEMSFFMGNDPAGFELDVPALEARASQLLGDKAGAVLQMYRSAFPAASPSAIWIQIHSDYSLMLPTLTQADRHAAAGDAGTWLYRLEFPSPALGGKLGALHTMEGNLLFNQPGIGRALLGESPEVARLARQMSAAWVNFARTGNPDGVDGLPSWPRYHPGTAATMIFDTNSRVANHPMQKFREALEA